MAYLGQPPFQEFSNPPTKDDFTGDGSTTTFDLDQEVPSGSQNALEVYIDNVRQEPGTGKAFTLGVDGSGDHKRVTFTLQSFNVVLCNGKLTFENFYLLNIRHFRRDCVSF